jgi:hypothetical protein
MRHRPRHVLVRPCDLLARSHLGYGDLMGSQRSLNLKAI